MDQTRFLQVQRPIEIFFLAIASGMIDTSTLERSDFFVGGFTGNFNHFGIRVAAECPGASVFVVIVYVVYCLGFGVSHLVVSCLPIEQRRPSLILPLIEVLCLVFSDVWGHFSNFDLGRSASTEILCSTLCDASPGVLPWHDLPWHVLLACLAASIHNENAFSTTGVPVVTLVTGHTQTMMLYLFDMRRNRENQQKSDELPFQRPSPGKEDFKKSAVIVAGYLLGCVFAGQIVVKLDYGVRQWALLFPAGIVFVHCVVASLGPDVPSSARTPPSTPSTGGVAVAGSFEGRPLLMGPRVR